MTEHTIHADIQIRWFEVTALKIRIRGQLESKHGYWDLGNAFS